MKSIRTTMDLQTEDVDVKKGKTRQKGKNEQKISQNTSAQSSKGSPEKIPRRDNSLFQLHGDTFISLTSDDSVNTSPEKRAAKKSCNEMHAKRHHSIGLLTVYTNQM